MYCIQVVSLGNMMRSTVKENSVGVYQGGSLSCILWSIFANDLCLYIPDSVQIVQFADDTQIWTTGKKKDLPLLVKRMETALQCLHDWFCDHGMKVNTAKTEFMLFGTKQMLRDVPDVTVKFINATISCAKQVRNLGVIFDRHLSFQPHIDQLVPKCTGMLLALNHAKHVIPHVTIKYLITALVFSFIRYCMSVYGICNQTQIHRIQKLINFAARVLSGRSKRQHVADVIRTIGWLNAQELVSYHRIMSVHRLHTLRLPAPLSETIGSPASRRHQHNTRGAGHLTVPRISSEAGRNRLCYGGVKTYNRAVESVGSVSKGAIKSWLLSSRTCFYEYFILVLVFLVCPV